MHATTRQTDRSKTEATLPSPRRRWFTYAIMALGSATLVACGGGSSPPAAAPPPVPSSAAAVIGPAGGTLTGPDGVQVVIPAGALNADTTIGIARSSVGAPATFADNPPAGGIYEFTPHNLFFNAPVTIRMPLPPGADGTTFFMASPGEGWQTISATVTAGVAEWTRNSFSWGMAGLACAGVPTLADLYPCIYPSGGADAAATPATAITRTAFPHLGGPYRGDAGSWAVTQAATVELTLNYAAAADCENGRVKLIRANPAVPFNVANPATVVFEQPVGLTSTVFSLPGPGPIICSGTTNLDGTPCGSYRRAVGSTTVAVPFSHLDSSLNAAGAHWFGYSFSCNRPGKSTQSGGDQMTFVVTIPVPSATFAVGGAVTGLAGAGLVLANLGSNNLAVNADGSFNFSPPMGAGTPYAVSVLTQPSGQICTVTNGSGTVTANVSNIVVTCASASGGGLALVANTGADTFSIFRVDAGTGALSTLGTVPAGRSPSAVVISPNGLYAYVGYGVTRSVDSFSINATAGVLTPLGSPVGGVPDKLAMDPLGRFLWGINYGFSTISVLSIASNGVLDLVAPNTVASGNPSAIQAHPSGNFVYVASDTTNALSVYDVNPSTGALTLTPGGLANAVLGSRSLVVHPNGSVLYAASEGGSNVGAFSINPGTGALAVVSYTATGSGASSVVVHPNGTFAYVVLGLSEIGIYSINPATGALTLSGTPVSGGGNIALRLAINAAGTRLYLMNGGVSTLQPSVSAFVVSDAGATLTPLGAPTPAGAAGTFATDIALTP